MTHVMREKLVRHLKKTNLKHSRIRLNVYSES